ncbi:MAG: DUF711 family protein [Anaerolineae bacterium]|nr:DUF711 family protein [Anaerolineae bacterium]
MKIRSITTFLNPDWPLDMTALQSTADFITSAQPAFESAGYQVQTSRLATPPFPYLLPDCKSKSVCIFAQMLEDAALSLGFDYISIGPALPTFPESFDAIPDVLGATENVFASGLMASTKDGISLPAVRACAEIMRQLTPIDPNGFANLYFAALANVPPGAPFFPAAYHLDAPPIFSLAIECADLAVTAFSEADNLMDARQNLIEALEYHGRILSTVSNLLADQFPITFGGIDFSLAPFPDVAISLGTAIEQLGVSAIGTHGSLAAAAFLTDSIDRANFHRTGFSGLMLPVLEDATLAKRAEEGTLTLKDLLMYSAVCGTGLDTVPLPGDTTAEQISSILLDLAALAQRLEKPLTARLMPIPGKVAGDRTDFDFPFFANSKVLAVEAASLSGLFAGNESFQLKRR